MTGAVFGEAINKTDQDELRAKMNEPTRPKPRMPDSALSLSSRLVLQIA